MHLFCFGSVNIFISLLKAFGGFLEIFLVLGVYFFFLGLGCLVGTTNYVFIYLFIYLDPGNSWLWNRSGSDLAPDEGQVRSGVGASPGLSASNDVPSIIQHQLGPKYLQCNQSVNQSHGARPGWALPLLVGELHGWQLCTPCGGLGGSLGHHSHLCKLHLLRLRLSANVNAPKTDRLIFPQNCLECFNLI